MSCPNSSHAYRLEESPRSKAVAPRWICGRQRIRQAASEAVACSGMSRLPPAEQGGSSPNTRFAQMLLALHVHETMRLTDSSGTNVAKEHPASGTGMPSRRARNRGIAVLAICQGKLAGLHGRVVECVDPVRLGTALLGMTTATSTLAAQWTVYDSAHSFRRGTVVCLFIVHLRISRPIYSSGTLL